MFTLYLHKVMPHIGAFLSFLHSNVFPACTCDTQGQGVLSDKLRSFSMQDLTLINADDELVLRGSDPRMRRDTMDDMGSGASTLPRAKSTAARQSKSGRNANPSPAASHTSA